MTGSVVYELIRRGGVFYDVPGGSAPEVYENVCRVMDVPDGYDRDEIARELAERERFLSTAVGNGIAIPHPRTPLARTEDDQRLAVCFPREPVDMGAPDGQKVFAMFILLNKDTQCHLQVLSALAKLLRDEDFRSFLASRPERQVLLDRIKNAGEA